MSRLGSAVQMKLGDVERDCETKVPELRAVHDCSLYRKLDDLQSRYHYADESSFFADLVNTSTVHSQPFHRWARYREGYSPELVHELIRRSDLDRSQHYVMDPMCGSGTTVVAANELGFDALGCDVNPYAVDLTNAKACHYSASDLEQLGELVSRIFSESEKYEFTTEAEIRKYFPPDNLEELLVIRRAMERLSSRSAYSLAKMAWLSIIEDCSNRKKDGNGLATVTCRVTDVRSFFAAKLRTFMADIEARKTVDRVKGSSVECSALSCEIAAKSFATETNKWAATVIFSPPYANSFDYFESYKLELLLGEYCDLDSLVTKRANAVRNYRISYGYELQSTCDLVEMTCAEILSAVPEKEKLTGKRDARTRIVPNLLRGYFDDMQKVLASIFTSLVSGGRCFIVVDQSAYVGIVVATDLLLAALGERSGFSVDLISKCRRANTSGQQLERFPYLRKYLRESIVALRKP
jgi:SAM-dependent methyltransferase